MKTLTATFLFCLSAVFAFNCYVDPFGLLPLRDLPRLTKENTEHCSVDLALVPTGAQDNYKEWLLDQEGADTTVVGTSRVMRVRENLFPGHRFVNFGITGTALDDYPALAIRLRQHPRLRRVLLSFDFPQMGGRADLSIVDRYQRQYPSSALVHVIAEKKRQWRLWKSAHLKTWQDFTKPWDLFTQYLSYAALSESVREVKKHRGEQEIHRVLLPASTSSSVKCILTRRNSAEEVRAAWDGRDGSNHSGAELLLGDAAASQQKGSSIFVEAGGFWHWFQDFQTIPQEKIDLVDQTLALFAEAHIDVIGFMPPFSVAVLDGFRERGILPLYREADQKLAELFRAHGFRYISLEEAGDAACPREEEYSDPRHATAACTAKFMAYVLKQAGF